MTNPLDQQRFYFGRKEKLKSKKLIGQLFDGGKVLNNGVMKAMEGELHEELATGSNDGDK